MTYEYVCQACGHLWEAEQSIKDSALKQCVSCGEMKAKRLVSGGTGFLLKGGGWYADGYGSPGPAKASSSDDKPSAKSGAEGTESKPAAEAKTGGESTSAPTKSADTKAAAPSSTAAPATPSASSAKAKAS
jgi:putative FmdB family regulatory protein